MADPIVVIAPTRVGVAPGGQARATVTITNPGQIVEGYTVEVVDELGGAGPASYAQVIAGEGAEPGTGTGLTVSVYPQQTTEVVLIFTPGSGPEVPGGLFVFGVRVTSTVDASVRAVAEAELEVGRVEGLTAKLLPVTSSGRWQGRHVVEISNWGNSAARLKLTATDPDQALGYLVRPDVVEVPLGGTATARVQVRTRSPRLRGQQTRLPFTVTGEPDPPIPRPAGPPGLPDPARPMVDGAFNQKPILSKGLVTVASLVVVGAVAAGVYAFTRDPGTVDTRPDVIPPTPQPVATMSGPTELSVQWPPVPDVTGYELLQLAQGSDAPENATELGPDIRAQQVTGLQPGTEYCFQLRALREEIRSPLSDPVCAATGEAPDPDQSATTGPTSSPAGPTSSTAGPTNSTAGPTNSTTAPEVPAGAWLALVYVRPANAPNAEAGLLELQAALAGRDVSTRLVRSSDYPDLVPALQPSLALALDDDFGTRDEAQDACQPLRDDEPPLEDCLLVQPNP